MMDRDQLTCPLCCGDGGYREDEEAQRFLNLQEYIKRYKLEKYVIIINPAPDESESLP